MYADSITGSMRRALDETERRRNKQRQHNLDHGITPKGIERAITDIMQAGYEQRYQQKFLKVAEHAAEYAHMTPARASKEIEKLEKQMYAHAKNLEFEQAAAMRDKIDEIRKLVMGAGV
jgi:excinuclease ABC subunit B